MSTTPLTNTPSKLERLFRRFTKLEKRIIPNTPLSKYVIYLRGRRILVDHNIKLPFDKLFTQITLEINTDCNYNCSFCCQATEKREKDYIDEKTLLIILKELKALNFKGSVGFQANNDPLLSPNLTEIVSLTRKYLPKNSLYIRTNGSLLTKELARELLAAGLSKINVSDYTKTHKIAERITGWMKDDLKDIDNVEKKIETKRRGFSESLSNRGGNAALDEDYICGFSSEIKCFCPFPFCRLVISPKGKVTLCCSDYNYEHSVGSITTNSLKDIWFSKEVVEIREHIYKGDRKSVDLCKGCNFVNFRFNMKAVK